MKRLRGAQGQGGGKQSWGQGQGQGQQQAPPQQSALSRLPALLVPIPGQEESAAPPPMPGTLPEPTALPDPTPLPAVPKDPDGPRGGRRGGKKNVILPFTRGPSRRETIGSRPNGNSVQDVV